MGRRGDARDEKRHRRKERCGIWLKRRNALKDLVFFFKQENKRSPSSDCLTMCVQVQPVVFCLASQQHYGRIGQCRFNPSRQSDAEASTIRHTGECTTVDDAYACTPYSYGSRLLLVLPRRLFTCLSGGRKYDHTESPNKGSNSYWHRLVRPSFCRLTVDQKTSI